MEELRPHLTVYAYNLLDSWEAAMDTVQDVFLKYLLHDNSKVNNIKAYLSPNGHHLAMDNKTKSCATLETYPGHWLPEAIASDTPETALFRKEILSYSLLVLPERLGARQRAVFIFERKRLTTTMQYPEHH